MKWEKDIDENIRCGMVEILILQLLSEREMYGYEIRHELEKRTDGAFLIKEGSLYGPLYRMQQRGLISAERVVVGEKRFRNYFHIEESGKEYLAYGWEQIHEVYRGVNALLNYSKRKLG